MFATHKDIITKVCKQMPDLIDPLLDGLLWHASMVVEGKVSMTHLRAAQVSVCLCVPFV